MCRRYPDQRWLTKEEKKRGLRISHSSDRLNDATDAKQEQKRRRAETDVFSDNNTFVFLKVIAVTSGKRVGLDERGRRSGDQGLDWRERGGGRAIEFAVTPPSVGRPSVSFASLLHLRTMPILHLGGREIGPAENRIAHQKKNWDGVSPPSSGKSRRFQEADSFFMDRRCRFDAVKLQC